MSAETLVEALEEAGVGTYSAEYRGMVARDAEAILKVSARFASPEAKREVLRTLLAEVEATGLAEDFAVWMDKEYPPRTIVGSGRWHARPIWRYLRHRICQRTLAPLEAP